MFIINNTSFEFSKISPNFTINSCPTPYDVTYNRFSTDNLINFIDYEDGDMFIIDSKVNNLYNFKLPVIPLLIDAKEQYKSINTVLQIVEQLKDLNKKNKVICIGGGITQDICATFCKLYKRGINWIFLPTTVLSMADSCIGAKSCLNYKGFKNQLGLFSAPNKVIINPEFINTLSENDIKSGFGEIIKLYIIGNIAEKYAEDSFEQRVLNALHIKKAIIEADEFETKDIRIALNYGHTIGHALESFLDYQIPHGEAVLNGIYIVNKMFNIPNLDIVNTTLPKLLPSEISKLVNIIAKDKKATGTHIKFILSYQGITYYEQMNIKDIERRLNEII